jgi:hypothetical protein
MGFSAAQPKSALGWVMNDPLKKLILAGPGQDPRACRTKDEIEAAVRDMAARALESQQHHDRAARGLLSELRRDIAIAQISRLRRLHGHGA